ncbi:MAG: polyprenyl diphosphate synthase, partial [Candidatus Brocadiaceae bacterium]
RHVAMVMDGNGRWAQQRGLSRLEGHRAGFEAARTIAQCCADWNIPVLTFFAFSTENWKRPAKEVRFLMSNLRKFLRKHTSEFAEKGLALRPIGNLQGLPEDVRAELRRAVEATRGGEALTLVLALNYGGHDEIVRAARSVAARVQEGELEPEDIDERVFEEHLDTAGLPHPDLVIRTGGERRLSNFLLWQVWYAELYLTDTYWPDFGREEFRAALWDYARRERRFGAVGPATPGASPDTS